MLLNLASSCFSGRGQNESPVDQWEAGCRGGGLCLDVGMELLNYLGWVLWRRAQTFRKNVRKSVLAPQNKNMLTKSGPQTAF